ncbi:MAG: polynucleotide adenylyltransferase PcnB [Pseudohongiellaceae bacterium]|jgi:poly(A) polymerase
MTAIDQLPGIENATLIPRDQHPISRKQLSPNALKVLYRLTEHGFAALIVGGGVRDILLDKQPKDFDVATDATPEDVRNLFKNARIIGRRFKIVHIRFGREIIEVTTFRAHHQATNEIAGQASRREIGGLDSAHSTTGMILRDNVYGDIDEDAMRRDFTVNALYYTIDGFRILDFCNGLEDLEARQLRMIGSPEERYREDPVRMLRAVRFAAKLDFTIEPGTRHPITELAPLLESISPARLFDETIKLLTCGQAEHAFRLLQETGLAEFMFTPTLEAMAVAPEPSVKLVNLALRNTDQRLNQGKSVTPAFLFAALLWPCLQLRQARIDSDDTGPPLTFQQITNDIIFDQLGYTAIPKRFTIGSREIWDLQRRLERRTKRSVASAFGHPKFRAGYDFLLLREESGEDLDGLGDWWTTFQNSDKNQQEEMVAALSGDGNKSRRRKRRRGGKQKSGNDGSGSEGSGNQR